MAKTLGGVLAGAFQQNRKPGDEPIPETPTVHELVNTNLYPHAHVVTLETRDSPLMVSTHTTVLSWEIVEALFASMLQFRLRERGMVVGMAPNEAPPKVG